MHLRLVIVVLLMYKDFVLFQKGCCLLRELSTYVEGPGGDQQNLKPKMLDGKAAKLRRFESAY